MEVVPKGICPVCGKGPRNLPYFNPDDKKQNICHACYARIRRYRAKGISRSLSEPKVEKEKKTKGIKIKYPDKEAVEAALKTRTAADKENYAGVIALEDMTLYRKAKEFGVSLPKREIQRQKSAKTKEVSKPTAEKRTNSAYFNRRPVLARIQEKSHRRNGRKAKYPARELAIVVLETREAQGKENCYTVLLKEDLSLYLACRRFEIELQRRGDHKTQYCLGDLVRNQNTRDYGICGKEGMVVRVDEKAVRVNFDEAGRITRVYEKWYNLNNIILCARPNKKGLAKKPS